MGNLTQLIKDKTIELNEIKTTIDVMSNFIQAGDEASLRDLKHQCSLIVDKLNKKYLVNYSKYDVFDVINFEQFEYDSFGIDLCWDFGHTSMGRFPLFRWNECGKLEMNFTRHCITPNEIVDIVYDVYSNDILKDIFDIIKNHIEPTRKLKKDLDNKRNKYRDMRREVEYKLRDAIEFMVENGDVITFDEPTYIPYLETNVKSVQFVREPNKKLGVVKVEYKHNDGNVVLTSDNWFNKKKQVSSIVDILHTYIHSQINK